MGPLKNGRCWQVVVRSGLTVVFTFAGSSSSLGNNPTFSKLFFRVLCGWRDVVGVDLDGSWDS